MTVLGLIACFTIAQSFQGHSDLPKDAGPPPVSEQAEFKLKHEPRLTFGGHARTRVEAWENFGFNTDNDDVFLLTRLLVNANYKISESTSAFVELKTVMATDRSLPGGRRSIDVDSIDIQNAYLKSEFGNSSTMSVTITAGRQPLKFGRQRLLSSLPWANNLRSFDGGRVTIEASGWAVDGFYTRVVANEKYEFNDWTSGSDVFGIYATTKLGANDQGTIDVYYIGTDRDNATFNGTTGHEQRHTFGTRINTPVAELPLIIDVEGAYQTGAVGSADVNAWFFAAEAVWKLSEEGWKPKLRLGFDFASGDDDPGGDVETFNQLFPLGHAYFGFADTVGRQNIIDASIGVMLQPTERISLRADLHNLWRASNDDALYNAGGGVVRAGTAGGSEVGQEIDLTANFNVTDQLKAQAGVSYLIAGDFIENSGSDDNITFGYVQLTFSF